MRVQVASNDPWMHKQIREGGTKPTQIPARGTAALHIQQAGIATATLSHIYGRNCQTKGDHEGRNFQGNRIADAGKGIKPVSQPGGC